MRFSSGMTTSPQLSCFFAPVCHGISIDFQIGTSCTVRPRLGRDACVFKLEFGIGDLRRMDLEEAPQYRGKGPGSRVNMFLFGFCSKLELKA